MARRGAEALRASGRLEGPGSARWKGGEHLGSGGYYLRVVVRAELPLHPTAYRMGRGWVMKRANYVWDSAHPDDPVRKGEVVHHRNHIRSDDSLANLVKMIPVEHRALHAAQRPRKATGTFEAGDAAGITRG